MKCADFLKGMSVGIMIGAAVGMMMAPKKKKCSSMVSRVLKAAEDVVDTLSDTLGM